MSVPTAAPTRRNGQPSSCEPCRKSKLRCDHNTPTCDRCKRRDKLCVYHPAPLTRHRSPDDSPIAKPKRRRLVEGRVSPDSEKNGRPDAKDPLEKPLLPQGLPSNAKDSLKTSKPPQYSPSNAHSFSSEGVIPKQGTAYWAKTRTSVSKPGFLGLTSYSAVFDEQEANLGVASKNGAENRPRHLAISPGPNLSVIDSRQIELGAQMLLLLNDFLLYEELAVRWYEVSGGFFVGEQMIRLALKAIQGTFSDLLKNSVDKESTMLAFSKKVFQNSLSSIYINATLTPNEYILSMAGLNSRWEVLGLMFTIMGLGSVLAPFWDPLFNRINADGTRVADKQDFGIRASNAADLCLQFCDETGVINDPLSWLLLQHTHLLTLIHGDNDYRAWRKLGDLSTTVFALGLHQTAKSNDNAPFFLVELRKRLMGGAYSMDKQLATFLGRPPRISWRYCDVELPLDLSYEELFGDPSERDIAISKLDANGWNTDGDTTKASWTRIALLMGYIREDILELSLCPKIENLPERVDETSKRSNEMWHSLPDFLHYKDENAEEMESNLASSLLLYSHLDFLYNDFLLQRILVRRTDTRSEALIKLSQEILSVVLTFVSKSNRSVSFNRDLGWNVSYYGLPSAGVIAVELLRQAQTSQQPQEVPSSTPFSRSEAIQNLSVFASCLQTAIQPGEGNYDICQQARKAIRHILDRVLSSETGPAVSSAQEVSSTDFLGGNAGLGMPPDDDFMKWLDNLDWGQEPWTTFS